MIYKRDPNFNDYSRKISRDMLFAKLWDAVRKSGLKNYDILYVLNIVRSKVKENER